MPLPICTNCKWVKDAGTEFPTCHAPQGADVGARLAGVVPVKTRWMFCKIQRMDVWLWAIALNTCGRRGRWFQPKETK